MIRFEYDKYDNQQKIDVDALDKFLKQVWKNTNDADSENIIVDNEMLKQPYLKIHDGKFKPRNYIGFIYFEGKTIEVYPKVFEKKLDENNKYLAFQNILLWLSYYQKFNIPHLDANLDNQDFDSFLEIFLYLITKFIEETIYKHPYYHFEEIRQTLYTPKGRIDFNDYCLNKLPRGAWHQLDCVYEPFIYDNLLNQVIKYTCSLINSITKNEQTKKLLQNIFFIMDEVSDQTCTVYDIDSIFVNPLFDEYENILYYCRMIIEQQIYSNQSFEIKQLCFLLPMEIIFEDFVYGMLKKNVRNLKRQKSDLYLATIDGENVFKLIHDIYSDNFIIDTKYKIRSGDGDSKYGVSSDDMYQLVSYGFRRGIEELYLFYPNAEDFLDNNDNEFSEKTFAIKSQLQAIDFSIRITARNVPFWSLHENFEKELNEKYEEIADGLNRP